MKVSALKSRLARRIFATFVACALIPVIVLAAVSLSQVSRQLTDQAQQRLRRAAKSYGLSIYEHLLFCEDELKLVGLRQEEDLARQREKFEAIGRRLPDGRYDAILGDPIPPIRLSEAQREHLALGASLLVVTERQPAGIILIRYVDPAADRPALLMGALRGAYLWGLEKGNNLPPVTEFLLTTETAHALYRSPGCPVEPGAFRWQGSPQPLRVSLADGDWFAAGWTLFLESGFAAGSWTLVLLQPRDHVLAPVERFTYLFVLVVMLALLLVVALSLFNLRRSLGPIEALRTGARRIAGKDFAHRVTVDSRDEFRDLADSFNAMSSQLGRQFQILSTQAEIDQATLMARDFNHIAGLSVTRVLKDLPFLLVAICRVDVDDPDEALIYVGHRAFPDAVTSHPFRIAGDHLARFDQERSWTTLTDRAAIGPYLPADLHGGLESVTLYPVFVKERLYALLAVAMQPGTAPDEAMLALMRQIADHLAVAWSNVDLIRDLKGLTIGSMQALARAVDAKSPWTAGHSARVMRIAMGIGRQLGFSQKRIDRLQQAALLHDIGKIGISSGILDKPDRLTDEEFAVIRTHPAIGDTILSPIPAFKAIIPIVRQHHERWDGKGYPDGLAGEAIALEARILAVADVYDAIASDRPYRKGMALERVVAIIDAEAGRQFDPAVVAAFMDLIEQKSALAA